MALLVGLTEVVVVGADITTTTQQMNIPLPPTFTSCTGATLVTSGTIHQVVQTDNTGIHFIIANFQNGTATDSATGVVYRATSSSIDSIQFTPGATTSQTLFTFHLVGQGQTPDLAFTSINHITVNADGNVTAVIDTVKSVCR
jgi:hypothetical protein